MDEKYRKRITDNINRLIDRTNFDKLAHACYQTGLLTHVMLDNVKRIELSDSDMTDEQVQYERHKRLFLKITKRGPDAFDILRRIFADLKYDGALGILLEDDSYVSIHNSKITTTTRAGGGTTTDMELTTATTSNGIENKNISEENNINNNINWRNSSYSSEDDNRDDSNMQVKY